MTSLTIISCRQKGHTTTGPSLIWILKLAHPLQCWRGMSYFTVPALLACSEGHFIVRHGKKNENFCAVYVGTIGSSCIKFDRDAWILEGTEDFRDDNITGATFVATLLSNPCIHLHTCPFYRWIGLKSFICKDSIMRSCHRFRPKSLTCKATVMQNCHHSKSSWADQFWR